MMFITSKLQLFSDVILLDAIGMTREAETA